LRWLVPGAAGETGAVVRLMFGSSAPADYRFLRECECAFRDVRAGVKMGVVGRPPTPTIT
jgi:hypothetical protein